MMDAAALGRGLMYLGAVLLGVGALVMVLSRVMDLGHLPGDVVYSGENVSIYAPLGTMIVLSLLLTLLLNLAVWWFR